MKSATRSPEGTASSTGDVVCVSFSFSMGLLIKLADIFLEESFNEGEKHVFG